MNSATLLPMRHWLLRYRRILSALLTVALLSTLPLAHAVVGKTAPAMAAGNEMPCHHALATVDTIKQNQHACCQDSLSCLQHCLAGLIITSGLPSQPQLMEMPVRLAQIAGQPDKILFSITPLPEFDPPR